MYSQQHMARKKMYSEEQMAAFSDRITCVLFTNVILTIIALLACCSILIAYYIYIHYVLLLTPSVIFCMINCIYFSIPHRMKLNMNGFIIAIVNMVVSTLVLFGFIMLNVRDRGDAVIMYLFASIASLV